MIAPLSNLKIAVLGLGYVGLPLAVEFGKKYQTLGFDINKTRVNELKQGIDSTLEVNTEDLASSSNLQFSDNETDLVGSDVFIVTVPTPVDVNKQPNLMPLIRASQMLGRVIGKGAVIIYESTVYPGATEGDCIPVVEEHSGLQFNSEFFAGYSPERINPGDKNRRVNDIVKVTSGSTEETAEFVDQLYKSIITAGTFKASSIKVAEGSKIIENVQRDVNIALINELFQIFTRMGINTNEVIEAASTKWNFMKLTPGLVGGHCIGVDPYYLLYKSEQLGYVPDLMRTGREINDSMPGFLFNDFIRRLLEKKINPVDLPVALLGFTFKEDCPDIRNTKVFELYKALQKGGFLVTIYDPVADADEVYAEYGVRVTTDLTEIKEDIAFLAVGHNAILESVKAAKFSYIYDFKSLLSNK